MTDETVVTVETFVTGTFVRVASIMISGVVYYNRVMDNILSLMASNLSV